MPVVRPAQRFALLVLATAFLSTACAGFSSPRGWAPPLVESDLAYLFLDRDELTAVRLDDFGGEALWTFPDGDLEAEKDIDLEAVYGPPLFLGDLIILTGFSGEIVAITQEGRFSPESGSWRQDDIKGNIVGGGVLAGERLIFGTTTERLYVRSTAGGGSVPFWPRDGRRLDGKIWAAPVVKGDTIFVGTMAGKLYAFDLESGDELWDRPFEIEGAIADLSLITADLLFVPTLGKRVALVDTATGLAIHPEFRATNWVWTTPALADGVAYFGDFSGMVYALDITTGRVEWTYDAENKVKARPAIIGDTLVVVDEGGSVHFVDLMRGDRKNLVKLEGAGKVRAPIVEADGFAYIMGTKGRLYRADAETLTVVEREIRGLGS